MSDLMLDALQRAERFMAGFEDDETQEGVVADLTAIRAAITEAYFRPDLAAGAKQLLTAVDFDNNGITVGLNRLGGNGGLISIDTTKAADALRLLLDRIGAN